MEIKLSKRTWLAAVVRDFQQLYNFLMDSFIDMKCFSVNVEG